MSRHFIAILTLLSLTVGNAPTLAAAPSPRDARAAETQSRLDTQDSAERDAMISWISGDRLVQIWQWLLEHLD